MTKARSLAELGGAYDDGALSNRNKIINGNFDIWQRGTSFSSSGYGADRWANSPNGSSMTQSRQSFTLGQTDVPNEPTYFCRSTVTSSAGAGNYALLSQRIEDVRTLAGQTATLSFWAKADASKNIAVEFKQYFGTGGSPSSDVNGLGVTTCSLTTSWQKFTVTVSVPSISGKTLGTDNNHYLTFYFWFEAGSNFNSRTNSLGQQSGTFDIAQVQLEAGDVATPFEMRSIGQELALCQRYYQTYTEPALRGVCSSSSVVNRLGMQLPVVMRSTPTATVGALPVFDGINVSSVSSVSANHCTDRVAEFGVNVSPASLGVYRPVVVYQAGSATLTLDAEL